MEARIDFTYYHDGYTPTSYQAGDEVLDIEGVPAEWLEDLAVSEPVEPVEPVEVQAGDDVPVRGKRK